MSKICGNMNDPFAFEEDEINDHDEDVATLVAGMQGKHKPNVDLHISSTIYHNQLH